MIGWLDNLIKLIEGKELLEATEIAKAFNYTIRIIKLNGKNIPVLDDYETNRMNVKVVDGIVIKVLNFG